MGGQTDSQVGLQVAKSRTFYAYTVDLRSTCTNASRHKWVAKRNVNRKRALTCESVWPGFLSAGVHIIITIIIIIDNPRSRG